MAITILSKAATQRLHEIFADEWRSNRYNRESADSHAAQKHIRDQVHAFQDLLESIKDARIECDAPKAFGPGYNKFGPITVLADGFKVDMGISVVVSRGSVLRPSEKESLECYYRSCTRHAPDHPQIPPILTSGSHIYSLTKENHARLLELFQELAGKELEALQRDYAAAWERQMARAEPAIARARRKNESAKAKAASPEGQEKLRQKRLDARNAVYPKFFDDSMRQLFDGMSPKEAYALFDVVRRSGWKLTQLSQFQNTNKVATAGIESEEDLQDVLNLAKVHAVLEN